MRLLINAEPFGFGPAAAAAAFAENLFGLMRHIGYAGEGHTLDLHCALPYDDIYRMTDATDERWLSLLSKYDAVLTATDERVAALALSTGVPVAFYDPLSWYWNALPEVAYKSLYIAQDFIGVRERLAAELPGAVIVRPICVKPKAPRASEIAFLNLGGLHNPMWPAEDADAYAKAVIRSVRAALPDGLPLEVAASSSVEKAVRKDDVRVRSAAEVAALTARSRFAFMTPGLGNIYEAAATGVPVCWLPPANGSQGQQLALIEAEGMSDVSVSWAGLGLPADYSGSQSALMAVLSANVQSLKKPGAAAALDAALAAAVARLMDGGGGGAAGLLERFGHSGAPQVAATVMNWLNGLNARKGKPT